MRQHHVQMRLCHVQQQLAQGGLESTASIRLRLCRCGSGRAAAAQAAAAGTAAVAAVALAVRWPELARKLKDQREQLMCRERAQLHVGRAHGALVLKPQPDHAKERRVVVLVAAARARGVLAQRGRCELELRRAPPCCRLLIPLYVGA